MKGSLVKEAVHPILYRSLLMRRYFPSVAKPLKSLLHLLFILFLFLYNCLYSATLPPHIRTQTIVSISRNSGEPLCQVRATISVIWLIDDEADDNQRHESPATFIEAPVSSRPSHGRSRVVDIVLEFKAMRTCLFL